MLKFNESCRKSVLKLDKYTGEILAEYASIVEATNAVGLKSKGDISKCCKGKTKTAGGFKWKYKEVVS